MGNGMKANSGVAGNGASSVMVSLPGRKPTDTNFVCKHCDRPFKTQDAFTRHLANKHGVKFHE